MIYNVSYSLVVLIEKSVVRVLLYPETVSDVVIAPDFVWTQCNMQHMNLLFRLIILERIWLVGLFLKVCAGNKIQGHQKSITPKE